MADVDTDTGTVGAWLDDQRKVIAQILQRGVLGTAIQ